MSSRVYRLLEILVINFCIIAIFVVATNMLLVNSTESFSIISVHNSFTNYEVELEEVKNIDYYKIEIYDSAYNKVFVQTSKDNISKFQLSNLISGEEYEVSVIAYKKSGDYIISSNQESFIWEEPSFDPRNSTILKDKDYQLKFVGNILQKPYSLEIKENDQVIYTKKVLAEEEIIPKELYYNKKMTLEANLLYEDAVVSSVTLYNGFNPIEDVKITSPKNNSSASIGDVNIAYAGGNNAIKYTLALYENNKLVKEQEIYNKKILLPESMLKINTNYRIVITAINDIYQKSDSINIRVLPKIRQRIVETAIKELGNEGGEKFWTWYGTHNRVEWCGIFISWVANENGLLNKAIPRFDNVGVGARWFDNRGQLRKEKSYTPQPADIIFFDYNVDGRIDHVGIVEKVDSNYVYTIEGNSKDVCQRRRYKINSNTIYAYGVPDYQD